MKIKKFGSYKIYRGLLNIEAVWDKTNSVVAIALTKSCWFGRKEILRLWQLNKPCSLDQVRQLKFTLDDLFGAGPDKVSKPLNTKTRKERRNESKRN